MSTEVSEQITRKSASNLALAFIVLPRPQREAMSALYAFCREVDDVADDEARPVAERQAALEHWRRDVAAACAGGAPELIVNRELRPFIAQYHLPFRLFDELIQGVEMDLRQQRYATFAELDQYCYRVASVVGLLSIEIFGYRDPGCRVYAEALGKALQYTNILRDVGNDAWRGRVYLPAEELERHGLTAEDILARRGDRRFTELACAFGERAREYYRQARSALPECDRKSMIAAELMGTVYWKLFRYLERRRFPVLGTEPLRLSKAHKLWILGWAWLRLKAGAPWGGYG
ncbi:MAG TPA: presqualene diphosphate synthase HpnD [Verrucomicrobiota bacterium]|nr:squalene synthase HpnD [Verrucomicrobiales bacterium]HRI16365.1 presqualene diphosphate synthase HpnD [Verrucomicrobiota bacterium]